MPTAFVKRMETGTFFRSRKFARLTVFSVVVASVEHVA
jgi:hypothetical protein